MLKQQSYALLEASEGKTLLISAQRRNILTEAEVAEIMRDFQQRGEQGQYLKFGIFFSVVGRKQM